MGPAAFMWPADRPWSASADNTAPCGSHAAIGNRTDFPLGAAGKVSFTIADDTTQIDLRIAYGNNPTSQSDFSSLLPTIQAFEPGHQCYSVPAVLSSVTAGTNATIQMEYRGNDSGKDESFYACADITFVEAEVFSFAVNCFNVTVEEIPLGATPSTSATTPTQTGTTDDATKEQTPQESVVPVVTASKASGLTVAEKAGIAVAVVVGAFLVASVVFFMVRRKRSPAKDAETAPGMTKVASFNSADAPRN